MTFAFCSTYRHGKHGDAFCLIATVDIKAGALVFHCIFQQDLNPIMLCLEFAVKIGRSCILLPQITHGGRFDPQ
jgi:hypothetical protein